MKKFIIQFTELVSYETTVEAENENDAEEVIKNGDYGTPETWEVGREFKSLDDIKERK